MPLVSGPDGVGQTGRRCADGPQYHEPRGRDGVLTKEHEEHVRRGDEQGSDKTVGHGNSFRGLHGHKKTTWDQPKWYREMVALASSGLRFLEVVAELWTRALQ